MASDPNIELAAALVSAQAEMPMVGKSGNNTFDKYTYAKLEDYVKVIRPIFAKHGLAMLTSVDTAESLPTRKTANGKEEHVVRIRLTLTIVHKAGGSVTVTAWGEGQDRGDKGIYKAITGARKYALASALGLATSDDPEADNEHSPAAAQPQRPVAPKPTQTNGSDPRKVLMGEVREWTGFAPEDVGGVVRAIAKKLGIASEKFSGDELARCIEFVRSNKESKFEEVLK